MHNVKIWKRFVHDWTILRESIDHRLIPLQMATNAEFDVFLLAKTMCCYRFTGVWDELTLVWR